MSSPSPPSTLDAATQRDQDAQHYRAILHVLLDIGMDTARLAHQQAEAQAAANPAAAPDPTIPFDRISRAIRRTVALAQAVTAPKAEPARPPAGPNASPDPAAACKRIRRGVEDRINRVAQGPRADTLREALCDRLDTPDPGDDVLSLPIADAIAHVFADLCAGLRLLPGAVPIHLLRDLKTLRTRAAPFPKERSWRRSEDPPPTRRPRAGPPAAPPIALAQLDDRRLQKLSRQR